MNEWLAHLCNPQLKSQQLQDLKGPCYHQSKGFKSKQLTFLSLPFSDSHRQMHVNLNNCLKLLAYSTTGSEMRTLTA